MFIDSLRLGVRDIIKYKHVFILFEILMICISIITVSASLSIYTTLKEDSSNSISYSVIPVSYVDDVDLMSSELNRVFQEGGCTFFTSDYLNQQLNTSIVVLFGKFQQDTKSNVLWCVPKDFSSSELGSVKRVSLDSLSKSKIQMSEDLKSIVMDPNRKLLQIKTPKFL